jgi:HK97 family phage major capsid protein
MNVQELQAQHDHALATADNLVSSAERQKRNLSPHEQQTFDSTMKTVADLKTRIVAAKHTGPRNMAEFRTVLDAQPKYSPVRETPAPSKKHGQTALVPDRFSREYLEAFDAYRSGVGPITGSLQEGVSTGAGYAVPIVVDQKIVPLAPQDSAIRRLATVIPTTSDIRIPVIATRGTVAAKAETSGFTVAVPSMSDFTLSAFAAGVEVPISIELAQDAPWFTKVTLADAVSAFLEYEEVNYVTGSGSGQAQGLIGNVGAGVTAEPDNNGNLVSIDATWQVLASLKATYAKNASWLMTRATALGIRRAQVGTNLFEHVLHYQDGIELLHGRPVEYSDAMPTAGRGACPVLLGDFARGYIVGDRGGSALLMKKLDQTALTVSNGELVLLFYRRSDGRVRVAEAIQSLNIAAS